MEQVTRLDIERDGLSHCGGGMNHKNNLKINIRLAIKRSTEKFNFVLVHGNDLYEFADCDYVIDGLKVISDYHTVSMGNFKLLK